MERVRTEIKYICNGEKCRMILVVFDNSTKKSIERQFYNIYGKLKIKEIKILEDEDGN